MALKSKNKLSVEFSMASMSDLVFLLLIFFVITSTLVSPNALKLFLPQSTNQIKNVKPVIAISIDQNYNYYVGTEMVDFNNLIPILKSKIGNEPDPTIKLHVDKSVPVEYLVKVMNIAKKEQYRLVLATSPETAENQETK